jgi:hypothetical protein
MTDQPVSETSDIQQGWLTAARNVVEHKTFLTVDTTTSEPVETVWGQEDDQGIEEVVGPEGAVLLDLFTASMLTQVYDALGEANKARFLAMPLPKAVDFGWKLIARVEEKNA